MKVFCTVAMFDSFKCVRSPRIIKIIFLFVLFIQAYVVAASDESEARFDHFTSRDGMSQNYVTSIFQDNSGMLWIGTFNGLNRYDAYKFRSFYSKENVANSLSQNSINAIIQDRNGVLWFATEKGLNKYNSLDESFTRYYNLDDNGAISSENNIRTIVEDSDGLFWVGLYGGGLRRFHPSTGKFDVIPEFQKQMNALGASKINTIFADSKGLFWIGTELGGLITFNPVTKEIRQFKPSKDVGASVTDRIITAITEDKAGNIWIGTWSDGLNKFNRSTGRFTSYKPIKGDPHSLSSNIITSLFIDKAGLIWIGTFDHGVTNFDPKTGLFSKFDNKPSEANSLSHNVVWRVFQDRSGVYWFGTFGGGLNKYNPEANHFESYKVDEGKSAWLNNNQVNAFLETSSGDLLLGTYGGGINKFDRKNKVFTYILNDSSSLGKIIRVLYEDSKKNIWVSTDQGLFQFDSNFNKRLFFRYNLNQKSIGANSVYSILEDDLGDMWFGIWNGGVKKLTKLEMQKGNPALMEFQQFPNTKFCNSTVWALTKDSENNIWIGANDFFSRYIREKNLFEDFSRQLKEIDKELFISINCFYEDAHLEKMWFGTLSNGVGNYDKTTNKITLYTEKDGLAHNEVYSILPDKNLNLWISTTYGLSQFNLRTNAFRNFDISRDGSQNEILYKSWLLSTKEILVGGNRGFYIFDPENIHDNVKPSPTIFTDFKVFNKSINLYGHNSPLSGAIDQIEDIKIDQSDNVFSIEFAVLDYRNPQKNEYQYMLDGFDKEWISTTWANRVATYTNLEGGHYVFKVKGCNSDGIWSRDERKLNIIIAPLFYDTWWFRILLASLALIVVWLAIRQKFNKLKQEIKEKHTDQNVQKLIDDKSTLALLNDELESDLDEKIKELAAVRLYVQNKDESLSKLRTELQSLLDQVKSTVKPQVVTIIKGIDQELKQRNGWDAFKENIDVLQNDFIKRIANEFPKLTQKDLIVCAHIRMAKTNKDIANHLNISLQSVEMARYRIRKKMDLDAKITLNDFLARY